MRYEIPAGMSIEQGIRGMIEMANTRHTTVYADFNDIRLVADKHNTISDVMQQFDKAMREREKRPPSPPLARDMTLRDHFAGLAMQGLAANADFGECCSAEIATYAYQQADAMLAAREKGVKP